MNENIRHKWLFTALGVVQVFIIGFGGIAGGVGLISDPSGANLTFSVALLNDSPFTDYLIPGIVLLTLIGFGNMAGGIASFTRYRYTGEIAAALGGFLVIWIVLQIWWIGFLHWIQPLYLGFGLIEVDSGLHLRKSINS